MNDFALAYLTPGNPFAFSGITNLRSKFKDVESRLESIDSYTIKREAKKPRKFNPYFVWEKRKHLQVDLIDFSAPKLKKISFANKRFRYLFCAIDGFSRFAWVVPMKNKKELTCINALNHIIEQMKIAPQRIISDRGSEFTSKGFINNLEKHGIKPIYANFKAGIVERFQRSLQSLISKYQKHYKTKNFISVLPSIVKTYNSRRHRIIGMSPEKAELDSNRDAVRTALEKYYNESYVKKQPKFSIGDKVRVQRQRGAFGRGYDDIFSDEIYNISRINITLPIPMYSLTSFDGYEEILSRFNESELQRVSGSPLKIVDIIKTEKDPSGRIRKYAQVAVNNKLLYAWVNG